MIGDSESSNLTLLSKGQFKSLNTPSLIYVHFDETFDISRGMFTINNKKVPRLLLKRLENLD